MLKSLFKIAFTLWSIVRSFNSNMPSIPAAKNANKEGMAKTTSEDSDTDESYDSLPELVACSDDEDSEEEGYRKKSASKIKTRGKDKSTAKAKNNVVLFGVWASRKCSARQPNLSSNAASFFVGENFTVYLVRHSSVIKVSFSAEDTSDHVHEKKFCRKILR